MHKMRGLKDHLPKNMRNKGSTTLEMCVIMPILFFLLAGFLLYFLRLSKEAVLQGNTYASLYTFDKKDSAGQESIWLQEEMQSLGGKDGWEIDMYTENGNVFVRVNKRGKEERIYQTEYELCTSRLRRWQLYGNMLWEQGD